jgi:hypothetical protein
MTQRAFAFIVGVLATPCAGEERRSPEAVAVVAAASGKVSAADCGKVTTVRRFDWLPDGCIVDVAAGSSLTLAFADGTRHGLAERTKAVLNAGGPRALVGTIRALEAFPPMPRVGLDPRADPGPRAGAVRIRDGDGAFTGGLYPQEGAVVLPASTVVSFPSIGGVKAVIELEDESGRVVLMAQTEATSLAVPAGILKPASRYWLRVRTVDRTGSTVVGHARFATLGAADIERRAAFKNSIEARGDAESLALLAEVDRHLGLLAEARREFQDVLAKFADDAVVRQALADLERGMAAD